MKIGQKLSAGLLGIVVLLATAGVFGLIGSGKIIHSYRELNQEFGPTATLAGDFDTAIQGLERRVLVYTMLATDSDKRALEEEIQQFKQFLEDARVNFKSTKQSDTFEVVIATASQGSNLAGRLSRKRPEKKGLAGVSPEYQQALQEFLSTAAKAREQLSQVSSFQEEQRLMLTTRELGLLTKKLESHVHMYLTLNRVDDRQAFFAKAEAASKEIGYLQNMVSNPQTKRLAARVAEHYQAVKSLGKYLLETATQDLASGGRFDAIKSERTIQEYSRINKLLQSDLQALMQISMRDFVEARESEIAQARAIQWTILIVMCLAIGSALFFSYVLTSMISSPLRKLQDAARVYGQGKLDAKIPIESSDELGELAASFNRMADNLRDTMVSRSFVADIIESLPDTLLVVRPDLTIKMVNRATLNLLGYSKSQLIGQPVTKIFSAECPFHRATASSFAKPGLTTGSEATYLTKGKRKIPVLFSVSPIIADNDEVQEFVCIGKDITELKQAERKLHRSLKALSDIRFALDQSAILAVTDAEGTITNVNDKYCSLLRCSKDELVGLPNGLVDPDLHPADYTELLWRKISRGKLWRGDTKLRARDGKIYWTNTTIVPFLDDNDKPFQYLAIQFDVTERKAAETELVKAKRTAEEHNRAKSQFLAKMSHELRTPLNAILGYCELLQEELEDTDDTDSLDDLGKIHAAGSHLLSIINDILDLSKIEAGKMEIFLESFEIDPMIQQVVTTIQPIMNRNSNQLILKSSIDIETKMYTDFVKVKQILINLLSNAAKFTDHGEITLGVEITQDNKDTFVIFKVADNGIGMTEAQLNTIFEAFTQADSSTTRKYGGTGLGLAITSKFCQMLGGTIKVESEQDSGSCFSVILPIDSREATKKLQANVSKKT